jgi:hypothetical protein
VRNRIVAACIALAVIATLWVAYGAFRGTGQQPTVAASTPAPSTSASPSASGPSPSASTAPAVNVYEHTSPQDLAEVVKSAKPLVYVPNTLGNTVQVIDPATYEIVDRFPTGREPHHVVPGWDLKTLYVNDTQGNDLIPIDPSTGKPGAKIPVEDPYNLYWTPDGKFGLVLAERFHSPSEGHFHVIGEQPTLGDATDPPFEAQYVIIRVGHFHASNQAGVRRLARQTGEANVVAARVEGGVVAHGEAAQHPVRAIRIGILKRSYQQIELQVCPAALALLACLTGREQASQFPNVGAR